MLELDSLLNWCDAEYSNGQHCKCGVACTNCNYCQGVQADCYTCIQRVHSYKNDTVHYNCNKMVLYYTLKHSYRFGAELFFELNRLRSVIAHWNEIKIMSIGCGPCSELFGALLFWRNLGKNNADFHFRGFDTQSLWQPIMTQIQSCFNTEDVKTYGQDAFAYYGQSEEGIDVIVLNYMLSDMMKFHNAQYEQFLNNLISLIRQKKPRYILINDVYLLISIGASNKMLRSLLNAGLCFKCSKLQYHEYNPIIGQFGLQIARQKCVRLNADMVRKYNPFQETNSIQTIIEFQ